MGISSLENYAVGDELARVRFLYSPLWIYWQSGLMRFAWSKWPFKGPQVRILYIIPNKLVIVKSVGVSKYSERHLNPDSNVY